MYKEYFRLNEMPFSIAPDPRFLYMSERHREAMAHLLYGVQGEGGIVLLTGEVGTGKTTICRSLLERIPNNFDVAFILNPRMSVEELLQTICDEFHIPVAQERPGIKTFVDAINLRLLSAHAQGRSTILIIDEAQNLDVTVLEQLRLLTNLETDRRKLLQIFLIGQPELKTMLSRPELRQVAQRVVASYHLTHLSLADVNSYVAHRLRVSGASPLIFPDKLIKQIYRASGGVPRLINLICDRALLGTYSQGHQQVSLPTIRKAAKEVLASYPRQKYTKIIFGGVAGLVVFAVIAFFIKFSLPPSFFTTSSPTAIAAKAAASLPDVSSPVAVSAPAVLSSALTVSSLNWPIEVSYSSSESLAFQSLFGLYGLPFDSKSREAPCQQAQSRGMRCYEGHGGLSDLFQLDQPVILRLTTESEKFYSVALTALDHQTATLKLADSTQRISLKDLANTWHGQYVAIWTPPPNSNGDRFMKRRSSIAWLRHVMQTIDGIGDTGSGVFDDDLSKRIRAFQLSEGIQPDGLVGPLTVIHLNVRSGKPGPHLVTDKRG